MITLMQVNSITATAEVDVFDFFVVADLGNGNGAETFTFSYDPTDRTEFWYVITDWWAANQAFPVQPFVPPPEPEVSNPLMITLTKRQISAALIVGAGVLDPNLFITTAVAAISDPVSRALALNDWNNAPYYVRTHPLFNDPELLASIGLDTTTVNGLWVLGTMQQQ